MRCVCVCLGLCACVVCLSFNVRGYVGCCVLCVLCVGCLNAFVCFKCDVLCRGVWYVVCVVSCLCACWFDVIVWFV